MPFRQTSLDLVGSRIRFAQLIHNDLQDRARKRWKPLPFMSNYLCQIHDIA